MSRLMYIPSNNTPQISGSSSKKDCNEYQYLLTQGRYIEPKIFSGFQDQRIKLTTVKKQLYNPKFPPIRRIEREEVLCRLSDEHPRHTTSLIQHDSSLEFGARLRPDKSKKDSRLSQIKLYRSLSLLSTSTLIKPVKYNYENIGLNTRSSSKPTENIFRSSSMYMDDSCDGIVHNDRLKSSGV